MNGKKLGFGLMRLPLLEADGVSKVDQETVCHMADRFIEEGFTYFDTAAPYHKGESEIAFRECVAKRYPREAFTITNKLSLFMIQKQEEMPGFFESQLERCGVEYFDYYLLHAVGRDIYKKAEEMDAFAFMMEKKKEGKVEHIGFSFHDKAELLEEILTKHPEMEYVQLQLNYIDWEDDEVEARKCYEVCVKHGKPVIVMEPVKGGLLVNIPEEAKAVFQAMEPEKSIASWAIRYAASLDHVVMVLSGMSDKEQMEDNLSNMKELLPMGEKELAAVREVAGIIKSKATISCTGCRYCVDDCPKKIAIPNYFKLVNDVNMYGEIKRKTAAGAYERLAKEHGKASECIKCKKCEGHCPQHLPITEYLKDVAAMFEVS